MRKPKLKRVTAEDILRICHECGSPTHDYKLMVAHGGTMLAPVCNTHLHGHRCPRCDRVIACACKSYTSPGEDRMCSMCAGAVTREAMIAACTHEEVAT